VAVLAKEHGIPFYVAAPWSTIDVSIPDGSHIPIEERAAREVTHVGSNQLAPEGAAIRNPAFDVTPHKYITAIVTDRGVLRPPFDESLQRERDRVSHTDAGRQTNTSAAPGEAAWSGNTPEHTRA
jgi:methylthioribose-1-phosphate isomerase